MSERKTISVYLSPRAQVALDEFTKYSGFGSVSRTVEEIILAYNDVYNTIQGFQKQVESSDTETVRMMAVLMLYSLYTTISRVGKNM